MCVSEGAEPATRAWRMTGRRAVGCGAEAVPAAPAPLVSDSGEGRSHRRWALPDPVGVRDQAWELLLISPSGALAPSGQGGGEHASERT
jgi:hypothetical protein